VEPSPDVSTFAEIFPPEDPVARFVVTMAIARNDIRYGLFRAGEAVDNDAPEAAYLIRLATSHFFEAEAALRQWMADPDVNRFVKALPQDARAWRKKAMAAVQKLSRGALGHSRNRTFHYPYPNSGYETDEALRAALRALADEEVTVVIEPRPGFARLVFADDVALTMALEKHDPTKLREQLEITRDGAIGIVNIATSAWDRYRKTRGLETDLPEPTDHEL
jgi:hypothetical protein